MALKTSRIPFTMQNPYRPTRPSTSKIIFLSFEGSATEEEYFERVSQLFDEIKSRIQFVSVAEDAVHTAADRRTEDQNILLSKTRPIQLLDRIEQFKIEKDSIYQFSAYPDDEFWIVTDVDQNWDLWKEEWDQTIALCQEKNYKYAISNPFFEIWLLLHHDLPSDEDKSFAVTETQAYQKTDHFRERLRNLGVPLKDKKHITDSDYTLENVMFAIEQAKSLHIDKTDLCPKYFSSTVYMILHQMIEMLPDSVS